MIFQYLRFELVILLDNGVIVGEEGVVGGLKLIVIPLQLLSLPPCTAVLEPHRHLPRLQIQLLSQLSLSLRLELVLRLEALLQHVHLYLIITVQLIKHMIP